MTHCATPGPSVTIANPKIAQDSAVPDRMERLDRMLLLGLLAVTLRGRLWVALTDFHNLIAFDILNDDAFYYFKIAENLVHGRGFTFDGVTPTNSFHPLYLLLVVISTMLGGESRLLPIYIAGVLMSLLAVLTGYLLYRFLAMRGSARAGLAALALWTVSPYFIAYSINGLETQLAMAAAVAVLHVYLRDLAVPTPPTVKQAAGFGALCGVAMLARSDLAVLIVVLLGDQLWRRRTQHVSQTLRSAVPVLTAALLVWLPWGLVSHASSGAWLPRSGAASALIARNIGWFNLDGVLFTSPADNPYFDVDAPPLAWSGELLDKMLFLALHEMPLLAPLRAHQPFSMWPHVADFHPLRTPWPWLLLVTGWLCLWRWWRPRIAPAPQAAWGPLLGIYLVLFALSYVWLAPAHWYFGRYNCVPVLLMTLWMLEWAQRQLALASRGARVLATLLLCAVLLIELHLDRYYLAVRSAPPRLAGFLDGWQHALPHLDPTAKIGAFQAGTISYFSGLDIVNLDGKVNRDAYRALKDQRLHEYIAAAGIVYIADWDWMVEALCGRYVGAAHFKLEEIYRHDQQWLVYRVHAGP